MTPAADRLLQNRRCGAPKAADDNRLTLDTRRLHGLGVAVLACCLAAGCAGGPELGALDATASLKALMAPPTPATATTSPSAPPQPPGETPSVTDALSLSIAPNLARSEAPPLEVYARIVRHSRGCWFGLDGVIEASHVLHADALPPENGGRVVVTIHERVVGGKSIWGARAFELVLSPSGDGADIAMQNVKFAGDRAAAMSGDVETWMHDRAGCRLRAAAPVAASAGPPLPMRRPPRASDTRRNQRKR